MIFELWSVISQRQRASLWPLVLSLVSLGAWSPIWGWHPLLLAYCVPPYFGLAYCEPPFLASRTAYRLTTKTTMFWHFHLHKEDKMTVCCIHNHSCKRKFWFVCLLDFFVFNLLKAMLKFINDAITSTLCVLRTVLKPMNTAFQKGRGVTLLSPRPMLDLSVEIHPCNFKCLCIF